MKIQIGDYLVNITAKYNTKLASENRMNMESTLAFLNEINCYIWDASTFCDRIGCPAMSERAKKTARQIYDALDRKGYFKGI